MSDGAADCEFNANQSTDWAIQNKGEEMHQSVHNSTPESSNVSYYLQCYGRDGKVAKFVDS